VGGALPTGLTGPKGSTGPTGPKGPTGPTGPRGKPGKVELVTCKTVGNVQHCTAKTVTGPVKFTVSGSTARATLARDGRVYATGSSSARAHGRRRLVLRERRALRPGRYTLTLRVRHHGRWRTRRMTVLLD
jgi:hypothetical protein